GGRGVEIVDQDPAAFRGHPGGQRATDAVAGAGDDDPLPGHHSPPPVSVTPPSMTTTCPVIHPASSDSKNETALPTSSGTPSRLSGEVAMRSAAWPSWSAVAKRVLTMPGATALTRTSGPSSTASSWVMWLSMALLAP